MAATVARATIAIQPAAAQSREDRREWREDRRETRRDVREARRDIKEARRDRREAWRDYRQYDWNRPDRRAGGRYYADRYYRDGRYYQERRLTRNDRIYRGSNGRYYCRRSDGTTGLIVGAVAGGLLGNAIDNGRSSTLGTILGAVAGGALGRSVDRGEVKCR
ncbi:MAG: glycine zipper 2TM domain-containing protein [Rhizorhabdus sp.]|nr:glycine zipper 2TM domain-containing protein [Rhizorhabdus sp.]